MLKFLCALMLVTQMYGAVFGPESYIPTCVFTQEELNTQAVYMPSRISNQIITDVLNDRMLTISDDVKVYVSALQEWSKNTDRYTREIFLERVLSSLLCHFEGRRCGYSDSFVCLNGKTKVLFAGIPEYLRVCRIRGVRIVSWQICSAKIPGVVWGERDDAWPEECSVTMKDFVLSLYDQYQGVVEKMLVCEGRFKKGVHPSVVSSPGVRPCFDGMRQSLCESDCFDDAAKEAFKRIMRVREAF